MSSTRHDRNYRSWDGGGDDPPFENVTLDPLSDPDFPAGSWQDTAKFFQRRSEVYSHVVVLRGGTEDGVDISSENHDNLFSDFTVDCGDERGLTLKGGSCNNVLRRWVYQGKGRIVEAEFGMWSSSSHARCRGNVCDQHTRADGQPVRWAYVLGSKPKFVNSYEQHVWWWSVCITAYVACKYVWHVWLGRPDA